MNDMKICIKHTELRFRYLKTMYNQFDIVCMYYYLNMKDSRKDIRINNKTKKTQDNSHIGKSRMHIDWNYCY
jgi:hypothetical protein